MSVSRTFAGLAALAPLLASASCSGTTPAPCAFCDAGKADLPSDPIDDLALQETSSSIDSRGERVAASIDSIDMERADAGDAPSLSPLPDAGYTLFDDFEIGEARDWQVVGEDEPGPNYEGWSLIPGDKGRVLSEGVLDTQAWHIIYATDTTTVDQIIEARLRAVDFSANSPSYAVALFGRYDPATDSGYFVALRGDGSVIVRKREYGANASWAAGVSGRIRPGVWYTVRLEVVGNTINAFLDGTAVYSVTDGNPLDGGGVALGSYGATMEVDRVWAAEP